MRIQKQIQVCCGAAVLGVATAGITEMIFGLHQNEAHDLIGASIGILIAVYLIHRWKI